MSLWASPVCLHACLPSLQGREGKEEKTACVMFAEGFYSVLTVVLGIVVCTSEYNFPSNPPGRLYFTPVFCRIIKDAQKN